MTPTMRSSRLGLQHPPENLITGTMYLPGDGIGYHKDDPLGGDPVSIFGSQSNSTMFFENPANGDSFCNWLFARSPLVLSRAARGEWQHGMSTQKEDENLGLRVPLVTSQHALILRHIALPS